MRFFFSSKRPSYFWGPPSLKFNNLLGLFSGVIGWSMKLIAGARLVPSWFEQWYNSLYHTTSLKFFGDSSPHNHGFITRTLELMVEIVELQHTLISEKFLSHQSINAWNQHIVKTLSLVQIPSDQTRRKNWHI